MEIAFRAALLSWLAADPALSAAINIFAEEVPASASLPWLGIVASASADFGHKGGTGREVRVALELQLRGDGPAAGSDLATAIERRIEALPAGQAGFTVASLSFLRSRAEQRTGGRRAVLFEYRARLIAGV